MKTLPKHLLLTVCCLLLACFSVSAIDFGGLVKKAAKEAVKEIDKSTESSETADTGALVKRAKTELRAAERKMFSGKKQEAAEQLQTVKGLLEKIEKADPKQKDLKSLSAKYARIKKDLDKRMGKSSAETQSVPKTTSPSRRPSRQPSRDASGKTPGIVAGKPSSAASAKLPYHAKQKMREFDNLYRSVEYSFKKMEEAKAGETTTPPEEYAEKIKEIIPQLQAVLDEAKIKADKKEVDGHPDFTAAQEKIDAIPANLEKVSGEVKAIQTEKAAVSAGIAGDTETLKKHKK